MEIAANNVTLAPQSHFDDEAKRLRRQQHKTTRPQLLTRDVLDGRTNAAKLYDRLVVDIENDLGGRENLSTVERALIEAFAGASVTLNNLNVRLVQVLEPFRLAL